jgi:hypothetical protein
MKIISSEAHAVLDYLTVVIFALAPTVIGLPGVSAMISYVLAIVHLSMTLVTDMPFSLVKIVPIKLHALVELIVGLVLVIGGFLLVELPTPARTFSSRWALSFLPSGSSRATPTRPGNR